MIIKSIRISNFKSIYGSQTFDFQDLEGLIKLSGPIGAGKTTLGEAILYGLYGQVDEHNIPNLTAWNTDHSEIELWIESRKKNIYIKRFSNEPLHVEIDGKLITATNKKDYQNILEDFYDVPKFAVKKMCIISFSAFNSLATMSTGETKIFLDDVFGFKTFTEYNDQVWIERKDHQTESTKLNAIYTDTLNQVVYLREKKEKQQKELENSVDITGLDKKREEYVNEGLELKKQIEEIQNDYSSRIADINSERVTFYNKKMECATLGKQQKEHYNEFKSGKCPTCGHDIDPSTIEQYKSSMMKYADLYKENEKKEKELQEQATTLTNEMNSKVSDVKNKMTELRNKIQEIDSKIKVYNNSLQILNENYDDLITEYTTKCSNLKEQLDHLDIEIGEWNEMSDLFSKTLRYNLLETLIPHINNSIQYYINKLEQNFRITFDQEFKPHIYSDNVEKEISYKDLSTGQRKSLDICVIFGIIQNIIANVNFNVFFLDELFTNMDADSRNTMLDMLKSTLSENRTVFVINHAEMADDYFDHKIQVKLINKKITAAKRKKSDVEHEVIVHASHYNKVF